MNDEVEVASSKMQFRISAGVVLTFIGQTVALVAWLVNMNAEVVHLRAEQKGLMAQIERIDTNGTRALSVIQQRQSDVIALNAAQDARLRDLEARLSEAQRVASENKFWIDQLVGAMRGSSHLFLPPK